MFTKNIKFAMLVVLVVSLMFATVATGNGGIKHWTGQGTDSLHCEKYGPEGGMHWVLTGASKVETATLWINGESNEISKRAGGTIHFDTPYYDLEGLTAYVGYTGTLARNSQLVISDYCPGYEPLEVEKTAEGSYDRTVEWELEKSVDPTSHFGYAGKLAGTSYWTVKATKTETLDNYLVEGKIFIYNPNSFEIDFTVKDVLDDGTVAEVFCDKYKVGAGETLTCEYEALPDDASATLNTATVSSFMGDEVATAPVEFIENLIGFDEGTLSDPHLEYKKVISSSTTLEEPEDFYCSADAADYTDGYYSYEVVNTAYLNGNLNLKASAKVTVECVLPALEVKKTAAGEWDRKVTWELDKSVDKDFFSGGPGAIFDAVWKVVATKTDSGPMNYRVTGDITIYNPAAIPQTFTLEDILTGAREDLVTVECEKYTLAPKETVVCDYKASQPDATAELNTVTVSAPGNKPQVATAKVTWKENLDGYDEGLLTDQRFDYIEEINKSTTVTFDEAFYCPPIDSGLYVDGYYSYEEVNIATLNGNLKLEDSAKVTVECRAKFQDETAWGGDTGFNIMAPGQWWYIFDTSGATTQTIWAGQTINVGYVTVSEAVGGYRTITINLTGGWILQSVSEPVKIQGYNEIPTSAPAPGGFAHKGSALVVQVPDYAFYAIHLDVGIWK